MTGAMYSAISGLKTHMSALNVIGNNISNVNTIGYKATRYTFSEALYTTNHSGSNGTNTLGGINPAQIGFGSNVGTIDLNMSTATYSPTGLALDCMIDGDGFFLVGDKTTGGRALGGDGSTENPYITSSGITDQSSLQGMDLTRVGNFDFKDGFLVDGDGNVVYGFLNTGVSAEANTVPSDRQSDILTAIRLPMARKLTEVSEDGTVSVTYELHYPYQSGTGTTQDPYVIRDAVPTGDNEVYERLSPDTISIDATGVVTAVTSDGMTITVGVIAIAKAASPNGVTHVDGRYYKALGGAGELRVTTIGGVKTHIPTASTGATRPATDPSALSIESAGDTELVTGGLESSNTDLATEISNMIVIQRGYQANTRIVTVTDSMLEELVNMKR